MPRPDVSEERRIQIIDASMNVFAKDGLEKARMDDIAKEAGLSKGALYWYFKSKNEIIEKVITVMFEREMAETRQLLESDVSIKEKLIRITEMAISDFIKLRPLFPLLYEIYAYALRIKAIRKLFTEYFKRYKELLIPIFQQAVDNGEIKNFDPEYCAITLGAIIEGTMVLLIYDPENIDIEEHMLFGVERFIDGIIRKEEV
jgi:AcrR family transcriptional regulator